MSCELMLDDTTLNTRWTVHLTKFLFYTESINILLFKRQIDNVYIKSGLFHNLL